MSNFPPLTDPIATALARLLDDAQAGASRREPAHLDIEQRINQAGLRDGDPVQQGGKAVGKYKRISATLSWAISNNLEGGEKLTASLVAAVKGSGGFRAASPNYCGENSIDNLIDAFKAVGWELTSDGALYPQVLGSLSGKDLTVALKVYADRARRGVLDNPLLAGTAKDLLEATAAHVITSVYGAPPQISNFPTLLAQAFIALGFAIPQGAATNSSREQQRVECAAYELACSLNGLRNKQGTGHGRPWISTVSNAQARFAIESMGNIASLMLSALT